MYYRPNKHFKIGKISTSKIEIIDIIKSWLAISLAFTIANIGLSFNINFIILLIVSALTIGIGFLLHELAHKFAAQHYGCEAEFRSFDQMLVVGVLISFLGFLFFAPGAVFISGRVTRKENGIVSAVGPLTNFTLAMLFLGAGILYPMLGIVSIIGFQVNLWLGLFNMIPFGNFDGKKILYWNRYIWTVMVIFGVYFIFFF
ncbi:hypothetical protein HN385_02995 [archaeon]|jgi:Zn-dependent protease|nr:hypothetical protein [archaeon]MBT3450532.1 hypothetical protein [archaeon]MBT6868447.1 hypothetical protein [archaeon]MBT7193546.1 hypothetical protein [archaeon]MBT7381259.1 hypothetical protein [archaeon]